MPREAIYLFVYRRIYDWYRSYPFSLHSGVLRAQAPQAHSHIYEDDLPAKTVAWTRHKSGRRIDLDNVNLLGLRVIETHDHLAAVCVQRDDGQLQAINPFLEVRDP